eukprot:Hpha_TRINITY_DN27676_c0_g1::TRINITY_DN27676_c0_g1_i1::g.57341::m.57341
MLWVVFVHTTLGYQNLSASVPNAGGVDWYGTVTCIGSQLRAGGGGANAFGSAFLSEGSWTYALCQADSDGDGYTNGQELGDPGCTWQPGSQPATAALSHPGVYGSTPGGTDRAPHTPAPATDAPLTPAPPGTPVPVGSSIAPGSLLVREFPTKDCTGHPVTKSIREGNSTCFPVVALGLQGLRTYAVALCDPTYGGGLGRVLWRGDFSTLDDCSKFAWGLAGDPLAISLPLTPLRQCVADGNSWVSRSWQLTSGCGRSGTSTDRYVPEASPAPQPGFISPTPVPKVHVSLPPPEEPSPDGAPAWMIAILVVVIVVLLALACWLVMLMNRSKESDQLEEEAKKARGVREAEKPCPDLAPEGTGMPKGPPVKACAELEEINNPIKSEFRNTGPLPSTLSLRDLSEPHATPMKSVVYPR